MVLPGSSVSSLSLSLNFLISPTTSDSFILYCSHPCSWFQIWVLLNFLYTSLSYAVLLDFAFLFLFSSTTGAAFTFLETYQSRIVAPTKSLGFDRVRVGDDGHYWFSFPANANGWITMLNQDNYKGSRQRWEIWLHKETYAGHFRVVSISPHPSCDSKIPQAGVAGEDRPATANEEENPAANKKEEDPAIKD